MWFFSRKTKVLPNVILKTVLAVLVLLSILSTLFPLNTVVNLFASTKQTCSMSCCEDGAMSCCSADKGKSANTSQIQCHKEDKLNDIPVSVVRLNRLNSFERVAYLNQLALIEQKSKVNFSSQSLEKPCLCPISARTQSTNLETLAILADLQTVYCELTWSNSFFNRQSIALFEKFQKSHSRAPPFLT
jgi:hypothetical protein